MSLDSQLPSGTAGKGTLVLVGGSVRAAAHDAARAGWQIIAVDRFGDADLTRICSHWFDYNDSQWPQQLASLKAQFLIGVGGFERTPLLEAICASQNLPIVFASDESALLVNQPEKLASLAADAVIHFPETWKLASDGLSLEAISATANPSWDSAVRYVLKPIEHAGGIGIRWATSPASLTARHWLQRFCDGTPIGVSYLACPDDACRVAQVQLLGLCQSIVDAQHPTEPFIYQGSVYGNCGSVGGVELPVAVHRQLERVGQLAAARFGLIGLFNIDFVLSGSRLTLLEINPRYSASMELLLEAQTVKGEAWSLIDCHIRAFQRDGRLSDEVAERFAQNQCGKPSAFKCKRIIYASRDVRFDEQAAQQVIQQIERQLATDHPHLAFRLADIPADRVASEPTIMKGQPICTLLIRGAADAHSAIQLAEYAAKQLQASLKTC